MGLFLVERNFGDELRVSTEAVKAIEAINDEEGCRWLSSFVRADQKKSYCLFEAPSAESIQAAADRNGLPADVIVPVNEMRPDQFV